MFSREFGEIINSTYFEEYLRTAASDLCRKGFTKEV